MPLTNKTPLDLLKDRLDYCTEDQIDLIIKLITLKHRHLSKTELLKMSGYDTKQPFDVAYPLSIYTGITDIYPNIDKANLFMDYGKNSSFGELVNANDLFFINLIEVFQQ